MSPGYLRVMKLTLLLVITMGKHLLALHELRRTKGLQLFFIFFISQVSLKESKLCTIRDI